MKRVFYIALGYVICKAAETETGKKTISYLKGKGLEIANSTKTKINNIISEKEEVPTGGSSEEEQITE